MLLRLDEMLGAITRSDCTTPGQARAHRHAMSTLITSPLSVMVQMFPRLLGGGRMTQLEFSLGASPTPSSAPLLSQLAT